MSGTYDSKIRNMRLFNYDNTQFVAAFPTERVPTAQAPDERHQHSLRRPVPLHVPQHAGGPRGFHLHRPRFHADRDPLRQRRVGSRLE